MRFQGTVADLIVALRDTNPQGLEDCVRRFLAAYAVVIPVRYLSHALNDVSVTPLRQQYERKDG